MKRAIISIFLAAFAVGRLFAVAVTPEQARVAARNWLKSSPALGCRVSGAVDSVYAINRKYARNIAVDLVKLTPEEQRQAVRIVKRYASGL